MLYINDNGSREWEKGTIIMYNKSKGYLIKFDDKGPEDNRWEKRISDNDFRFID